MFILQKFILCTLNNLQCVINSVSSAGKCQVHIPPHSGSNEVISNSPSHLSLLCSCCEYFPMYEEFLSYSSGDCSKESSILQLICHICKCCVVW